jgi:hypothetical protein
MTVLSGCDTRRTTRSAQSRFPCFTPVHATLRLTSRKHRPNEHTVRSLIRDAGLSGARSDQIQSAGVTDVVGRTLLLYGSSCTVSPRPAAPVDRRQPYGEDALLRSVYIRILAILSMIEDKISAFFAIVVAKKGLSDFLTRSQGVQSPDAPNHKVRYLWFRRSNLWTHTNWEL